QRELQRRHPGRRLNAVRLPGHLDLQRRHAGQLLGERQLLRLTSPCAWITRPGSAAGYCGGWRARRTLMPIAHESGYKLADIVKKGTNRRLAVTVAVAAVAVAAFAVPVSIS